MRYHNYHKHCHYSNIRTLDCVIKPIDYINRAKELGHTSVFTTQHGWTGNYLELYDLCKENNLKMIYSAELYIVKDRFESDRSNYHIIIIGKNQNAFYELNRIISEANKTGFYYKPRIDLQLLLSLNPSDFIVTSACVGGILRNDESINIFLNPILNHFGKNFYLEVQSHIDGMQRDYNIKMLELSKKYNISIIHANDSHYIYPEQSHDRDQFLKGKNMNYDDENGFMLDYPDYNEIVERYKKQGVLSDGQIKQSIQNTLILDECEELYFDKEVKMIDLYPNQDSNQILQNKIIDAWNIEKKIVNQDRLDEYKKAIMYEFDIIKKTNMANYFILNQEGIRLAIEKYGAVLTRTGRGSAVSFIINKLLGFTEIDRLEAEVPLYPTRFMSISRILETKSLPDIDFNFADNTPVVKAFKELLGEDNVYFMYALGTMQESSAFRNLCRAYDMDMNSYNHVAKDLDSYRNDTQWKDLIRESQKFIGTIENISPSPCSFIILDKPLSKEMGLIRVGDEICACIDGYTADVWKYLKEDFLQVTVWAIISKTFELINKPIPNIRELKKMLDDKVWKLYEDKVTATMNQVDTEISTNLVSHYKPRNVAELSGFVSAIRPGFASLLSTFLDRKEYTTGVPEVDEILKPSYNFLLYQESLMAFFIWCGMKEEHTYDIIKKISKKKFGEGELEKLKQELFEGFKNKTDKIDKFDDIWQVVEDASRYSFNASHALSVSWDSVYGAYLKANYPLEYYTVVLNTYISDAEKTKKIISEISYFNIELEDIKYGKSVAEYTLDKKENKIYKGIQSIKFCNKQIADELYTLSQNTNHTNFVDLLLDIQNLSIDTRQLKILTGLNFFSKFGNNGKLLKIIEIFDNLANRKQINIKDLQKLNINEELLLKYSNKQTDKMFKGLDMIGYVKEVIKEIEDKPLGVKAQVKFEYEYLEYSNYINEKAGENFYIVTEYKTYKDKSKPYLTLRQIKTGENLKTKIKDGKIFTSNPFGLFDVIKVLEFKTQFKMKNVGGKWERSETETEEILTKYEVY
jgi:DNA polymerase III alpha subunit